MKADLPKIAISEEGKELIEDLTTSSPKTIVNQTQKERAKWARVEDS